MTWPSRSGHWTCAVVLGFAAAACSDSVVPFFECPNEAWWESDGVGGVDLCPHRVRLPPIPVPPSRTSTTDLSEFDLSGAPDLVILDDGGKVTPTAALDGVPATSVFRPPWVPEPVDLSAKNAMVFEWQPPISSPMSLVITTPFDPQFPITGGAYTAVFINETCEAAHPIPACDAPGYPTAEPSSVSESPGARPPELDSSASVE